MKVGVIFSSVFFFRQYDRLVLDIDILNKFVIFYKSIYVSFFFQKYKEKFFFHVPGAHIYYDSSDTHQKKEAILQFSKSTTFQVSVEYMKKH